MYICVIAQWYPLNMINWTLINVAGGHVFVIAADGHVYWRFAPESKAAGGHVHERFASENNRHVASGHVYERIAPEGKPACGR